jgi:hypothetical protein
LILAVVIEEHASNPDVLTVLDWSPAASVRVEKVRLGGLIRYKVETARVDVTFTVLRIDVDSRLSLHRIDGKYLIPRSVKVDGAVIVFAMIELPPRVEKVMFPVMMVEPDNVERTSVLP